MWFYCERNRKCCFHASPGLLILRMPAVMLHLHPLFLQQVHQRPAPPTKPLPPDPALTPPPQVKCAEVCVLCTVVLIWSGVLWSPVRSRGFLGFFSWFWFGDQFCEDPIRFLSFVFLVSNVWMLCHGDTKRRVKRCACAHLFTLISVKQHPAPPTKPLPPDPCAQVRFWPGPILFIAVWVESAFTTSTGEGGFCYLALLFNCK